MKQEQPRFTGGGGCWQHTNGQPTISCVVDLKLEMKEQRFSCSIKRVAPVSPGSYEKAPEDFIMPHWWHVSDHMFGYTSPEGSLSTCECGTKDALIDNEAK